MKAIKSLTTDTVYYGLSSIVGRFINWALNPYWTYMFVNDQAQLGRISNIYTYVAFLFVILTFGMETGFFRFASKKEENKDHVFSTALLSVSLVSFLFLFLATVFRSNIASLRFIDLAENESFIVIMAITVVFDVISTIPFAKLRLEHRPIKFATLKLVSILINVVLNIFFLSICPYLQKNFGNEGFMSWFDIHYGIGYVFISNLIASSVTLLLLRKEFVVKFKYDVDLFKRMIRYSFPILIVGITGMINQNVDKILIPIMLPESAEPMRQLGIYTASFKMAVVLNMFIQAFRFAFEPFIFSQKNDSNSKVIYAIVMKYFIIVGLIIFVGMSTFIDIIKYMNAPEYHESVGIVPIVLIGNLFMGIYFNLSLWYKLTDKTKVGAYLGMVGSIVSILMNILLIPVMGYWASAISIVVCFFLMSAISYLLGQKYFKIPYDLKRYTLYFVISTVLVAIYWHYRTESDPHFLLASFVNVLFWYILFRLEKKEFINVFLKKEISE